jgi:hypothetical protein
MGSMSSSFLIGKILVSDQVVARPINAFQGVSSHLYTSPLHDTPMVKVMVFSQGIPLFLKVFFHSIFLVN